MNEEILALLGEEMRPAADLIIKLRAQLETMRGKEKFALEKTIRNLERDFTEAFNRDDTFERYRWPDGLTVNFVAPPLVTLKDGTQKLLGATIGPSLPRGMATLGIMRGMRPVFSRS